MLTEKMIRDLVPDGTPRTYWDTQVVGFGVQISARGKKNFIIRYRLGGRKRQRTLCQAGPGNVRLADARARASAVLAEVRLSGVDPMPGDGASPVGVTVAAGLDRFFDEFVSFRIRIGKMTARTVRDYRQQAGQYVRPALGRLHAADVTREDVERMVEPLTPVRRNRVLAFTSRLFTQFERWDLRPQNANPCRGIERALEEPRDRVLNGPELATLSEALTAHETRYPASVAAIRFAAVTGLRISEILSIKWDHVDFASGRLVLPSTKTGRRVHSLPAPALAVLRTLPRLQHVEWVFTSGRGSGALPYDSVRKHFARLAASAGLEDVRLHDLRRTVMTMAAASGHVNAFILRDLLGHKTLAMAERYIRRLGSPVTQAREAVGAAVADLMAGVGGEGPSAPRVD